MNRFILVEDGNENLMGTTTGYPTVDIDIAGTLIVGLVKLAESGLMI